MTPPEAGPTPQPTGTSPPRGRFVTIEGPDGGGKTTIAERLAAALRGRGRDVVLTREPGGTNLGERIRDLLLEAPAGASSALTDALLFNAARAQLVAEVIEPALAAGRTVICVRYADSTLAYQGYGEGLPLDQLRALRAISTGGLQPDRTILLDVPVKVGLARKSAETTRFETDFDAAFHERVRAGFRRLAESEPERFRVVDGAADIETVFERALEAFD